MTDPPDASNNTLSGSWIPKMARAWEHLNFLNEDIGAFLERQPYTSVVEEQPWDDGAQRGIEWTFRANVAEAVSREWPVRIGEFLYNLRSSLDHLGYILSRDHRDFSESERLQFPIFLHRKDYERLDKRTGKPTKWSGLHNVRFMPDPVRDAVEKAQPYNGGNADDPLWLLDSLRNFDMHKDIHVVGATISDPSLNVSINARGIRLNPSWDIHTGPFEDGAILARCRVAIREVIPNPAFDRFLRAKDRPDVEVQFSQPFDIAFDPAGPGGGKPVLATLHEMHVAVLVFAANITGGLGLSHEPLEEPQS